MSLKLNRRTLLRGAFGATAIGVALPALEVFLSEHGNAYADGSGFPVRFGWWFFGNGVHMDNWMPAGNGPTWELSPQLAPLAPVKEDITVVSGLKVYCENSVPHGSGPAGVLTGAPLGKAGENFASSALGAATIDQVVANAIGNDTRFRSLEIGVEDSHHSLSYVADGTSNTPETSPKALFERLFGMGFVAPGDEPIIDPKWALRRSVLDAVSQDATQLKKRLGYADKLRIDRHFDNIRALEKQIAKLEDDPPNLAACAKANAPLDAYPPDNDVPQMSAKHRAMADMMAMSLACDQTRVFSVMFSTPVNNVRYPGTSAGHHKLTHDELGEQPEVHGIVVQIIEELSYFLQAMKNVEEGDGTLLDHSAVLAFSDCSFGKSHAIDNYPLLVAGAADGALKKGVHYKSPAAENASKLGFTLLRAMGLPVTEFGAAEGLVTEGLSDIET